MIQTQIDEISPSIAYSPIEQYALLIQSKEGSAMMSQPRIYRKMLRYLKSDTQWGNLANDWGLGRLGVIQNVPEALQKAGTAAIKVYFRGK